MILTLKISSPFFTMSPGATYMTHRSPVLGLPTWYWSLGSAMGTPAAPLPAGSASFTLQLMNSESST